MMGVGLQALPRAPADQLGSGSWTRDPSSEGCGGSPVPQALRPVGQFQLQRVAGLERRGREQDTLSRRAFPRQGHAVGL